MYNNKNILYIVSAISAIEKIKDYNKAFDNPIELLQANNQMNFNATITLLIAIAEETKKIETKLLESEVYVQWQNIFDMRNVLAHDYRGIDPDIVFDVVKSELETLKSAYIKMLEKLPKPLILDILHTNQYSHLRKVIQSYSQ